MERLTQAELDDVIKKHKLWLDKHPDGIRADLRYKDISGLNMSWADMTRANMEGADMRWADIDCSVWPLWCGSFDVIVDKRIFCQLAYHLCRVIVDDPDCKAAQKALMPLANQFHRADECGKITEERIDLDKK